MGGPRRVSCLITECVCVCVCVCMGVCVCVCVSVGVCVARQGNAYGAAGEGEGGQGRVAIGNAGQIEHGEARQGKAHGEARQARHMGGQGKQSKARQNSERQPEPTGVTVRHKTEQGRAGHGMERQDCEVMGRTADGMATQASRRQDRAQERTWQRRIR